MSEPRTIMEDQAIGWIIRMRDPAFAGWEAFTLWLEENPVHAALYDELALADAEVPETLPAPPPRPSTPVPANGSLFIVNRNQLIAIGKTAAPTAKPAAAPAKKQ